VASSSTWPGSTTSSWPTQWRWGARITIVNADGPGEGFNDPTLVAPFGGNPGTTRGQRLIAFQFAADLWGAALDSNVDIQVQASFDPLGPNVLGAAAATARASNFGGVAGFPGGAPNTNYHIALADKRAGADLATAPGLTPLFPEVAAPSAALSTSSSEDTRVDMNRRTLLMSLVAAPALLEQEPATSDPSLYIPKAHLVEDRGFLHDFMDEYSFVDLVTPAPTLRITHIPVLLERSEGRYGTIYGHIAAQNPQRATFDGAHPAVLVFRGPHGYISPTWYAKREAAPTWNFAVVHASGRPAAIAGSEGARDLLARLIRRYEKSVASDFALEKLSPEYVDSLLPRIAPFRLEIEALEGKFKLGQERAEGDRQGVLARLREGAYRERSLYELTAAFYRRG